VQLPAKEAGSANALPNMATDADASHAPGAVRDSVVRNHDSEEAVEAVWQRLEVAIEDNFRCNKAQGADGFLARTPGGAQRGRPGYNLHGFCPSPSVIQVIK
jgi:hypothetical protein